VTTFGQDFGCKKLSDT